MRAGRKDGRLRLMVVLLIFSFLLVIALVFPLFFPSAVIAPPRTKPIALPDNHLKIPSPPVHGSLLGQSAVAPPVVDLTQTDSDWVHWGLPAAQSVERRGGVTPLISNYLLLGDSDLLQYARSRTVYTWQDAENSALQDAQTRTGVSLVAKTAGSGFQLTAPADTQSRTFRLYVALARGRALFSARLSDQSAPIYTNLLQADTPVMDEHVYSLTYNAASSGQSLTITFATVNADAQIALMAATLASDPHSVSIMPLGDSITFGTESSDGGGYRTYLWHELLAHGYAVHFVGSRSAGPLTIEQDNEGHPGYRIDQIQSSVVPWLETYHPQVVLLDIGTNDILQNYDLPHLTDRLTRLIDTILETEPDVTLLVAQIVPTGFPVYNTQVQTYNAAIPTIVEERALQGKRIQCVDMYDAVSENDLADRVHPDDIGYALMAQTWYRALQPILTPSS